MKNSFLIIVDEKQTKNTDELYFDLVNLREHIFKQIINNNPLYNHIKFKLQNKDHETFSKSHLSTELDLDDTSDEDSLDGNDDFDNEEAELEMSY